MAGEVFRPIPLETAVSSATPVGALEPCNTCDLLPASCGNQIPLKNGGADNLAWCLKKGQIKMQLSYIPRKN